LDKSDHLQSIFIDKIAIAILTAILKVRMGSHVLIAIVRIFKSTSACLAFEFPVVHSFLVLLHGSQRGKWTITYGTEVVGIPVIIVIHMVVLFPFCVEALTTAIAFPHVGSFGWELPCTGQWKKLVEWKGRTKDADGANRGKLSFQVKADGRGPGIFISRNGTTCLKSSIGVWQLN
jgi:hypothetical protein